MIKQGFKRLLCWYRKNRDYRRSRKLSDFRAQSAAVRHICSGSLQGDKLTGAPLARVWK